MVRQHIRFRLLALTLLIFFTGLGTGCSLWGDRNSEEDVLARVGQFDITRQHYLNELRRFYDRTGQAVNLGPDVMESVLDSRVNRYTIVEFAFDKKWHLDPEAQYRKSVIRRQVNMEQFEKLYIHNEVRLSEQNLRELYFRANTSIRASHLFARNKHQADSVFALLQAGRSFESLAKDIFKNSDLAESGGDLGFFTIDDMDIAFEDKAYSMEIGDISEPVRTNHGYSIIKVTDIITTPVITETEFANKRQDIAMVAQSQQEELATRRHLRQTIDSFDINEALIAGLWEAVQQNPDAYFGFNPEGGILRLDLPATTREQVLASLGDFEFSVNDFLVESHFTSLNQRARAGDIHAFREHVAGMAYRSLALSKVDSHPDYDAHLVERTIEETFYNYLNARFDEYLDSLVEVSDEMIQTEYYGNRELYVEPVQLNMAEIVVTTEDRADKVWSLLQQGENFNELLRQYTADPAARETNGELGFIPIDRFGMMAPSLTNVKPGDYAGPFQITGNRFMIFKCLDRIESRPLEFDEARPVVKRYLHDSAKEQLRAVKIRNARDQFNATIFSERLHSIPIQL